MLKKIGIGYEDYKRFIDDDMYYIDKTMLKVIPVVQSVKLMRQIKNNIRYTEDEM